MTDQAAEYARVADVLDRLSDAIEDRAARHGLTPADVAAQAGVPIPTVLALADGRDVALRSAAALLRWLGSGDQR